MRFLKLALIAAAAISIGCGANMKNMQIENELLPLPGFESSDLERIAIQKFDTGAVKAKDVDNVELRDRFLFDLTKSLYDQKKVRVIESEIIDTIDERETLERVRGDFSAATTTVERLVHYRYNPFEKVKAFLLGKITAYKKLGENTHDDYIEVIVKLVDSTDGTMFWVTKIKGLYGDVVYTITHTLSNKQFTAPSAPSVPAKS